MNLELVFPETVDDALAANGNGARWFAGGTDLIPEAKSELVTLNRLVNLKRVNALRGMQATNEGVRIGALTTLNEMANDETIRTRYRALAQACELAASPQIRNVATIGGNLNQDSRCPYYRNGFECYLRGGDTCFMRGGENREAAVIGYRDCVHVHPSDPANALVLFDAQIVVQGRGGERSVAAGEFFRAPDASDTRMNVLREGEIITAIVLPSVSDKIHSAYVKAMDRAAWTFALASAGVRVEIRDWRLETSNAGSDLAASEIENRKLKIENLQIVLGGVAPMPWREVRVAQELSDGALDEDTIAQRAADVLTDAKPLAHNGYKVRLARAMVKRALQECLGDG